MTSPMTPVESPAEEEVKPAGPPILIHITGPDHYEHLTMLPPGDALVVGSNPACGVHIQGDGIAGMHCTLSVENGQLVIDDWDTGAGTYVDGQRVARQKSVDPPAEVMIGPYKILTRIDGDHQATPEPADETADVNEPDVAEAPVVEEEPPVVDEQQPLSALVREELVNEDADDAAWDSPVTEFEHSSSPVAAAYDHSGFDDDTSDLLQVEIDFLRSELAERDAQIAQLSEAASLAADQDDDEDLPSREEVEALASRLEDLLAELEQSDERLKTMAELLRLSDEANVAAEEEREQMESWIGEVERRVRQWEDEWHAERDTLNKRLEEVTAQRDNGGITGKWIQNKIGLINSLREQSAKLEQQLKSVQQERDNLQHRMQTAEVESIEGPCC